MTLLHGTGGVLSHGVSACRAKNPSACRVHGGKATPTPSRAPASAKSASSPTAVPTAAPSSPASTAHHPPGTSKVQTPKKVRAPRASSGHGPGGGHQKQGGHNKHEGVMKQIQHAGHIVGKLATQAKEAAHHAREAAQHTSASHVAVEQGLNAKGKHHFASFPTHESHGHYLTGRRGK